MIRQNVLIINKLGLHARAAMKLVKCADRFQSRIFINLKGRKLDAKDIMNMLSIGAAKGTELELITDGDDEQAAMDAIVALIRDRFGENE